MSIFYGYKYLLYRIYVWQLALFGEKENPRFVAIACCSLFLYVNIQTAVAIVEILSGHRIYTQSVHAIATIVILIALNSYIFLYRSDFEELVKEFSTESKTQRRRNTIWCLTYVIFTHAVFFLSAYILNSKQS